MPPLLVPAALPAVLVSPPRLPSPAPAAPPPGADAPERLPAGHSPLPLVLALLAALTVAPARADTGPAPASPRRSGAERAVAELVARLDARWDERQAAALSEVFTPDAEFQVQGGRSRRGRAAIRRSYEEQFAELPAELRHHTRLETVRMLGAGQVFVAGRVAISDPARPDGERLDAWVAGVAVRRSGEWRLDVFRIVPTR